MKCGFQISDCTYHSLQTAQFGCKEFGPKGPGLEFTLEGYNMIPGIVE